MEQDKFIDISRLIESKNPRLLRWLPNFVINYLKRILHQEEINAFLNEHKDKKNLEFCDEVMKYFNIEVEINDLHLIPEKRPCYFSHESPSWRHGWNSIHFSDYESSSRYKIHC